ncbi:MAG: PilZ domain-containing protein [bacterium]|nr:MAG: PilZ domain-containing protein [bacterium]
MRDQDHYNRWKGNFAERRKWPRYPPTSGARALVEGRSYRLMDISGGGLAIYDYGGETVPEEMVISIHSPDEGFLVEALRCRKVSDGWVVSDSPYGRAEVNRVSLEIVESDPDMEHKLAPFMHRF